MIRYTSTDSQRFALGALALAAMFASAPAAAETPLSLVVSQKLTYDSNVLRNDNDKYRDAVSETGIQVGLNKQYGRQTYKGSVTAVTTKYKNTPTYDNDGYNIALGFASELGSNMYVSLDHTRVNQLQSPEDQGNIRYRETINSQETQLFVQYGMYSRWSTNALLNSNKADFDVINAYDRKSDSARLGLRYSPTDLLYFDFGVKQTKLAMPNYPLAIPGNYGDHVKRQDIDLSSKWVVTGYSTLNARIAWTKEKHEEDELRNFTGLTGRISWNYIPAGKMNYTVILDRDTNNAGGSSSFTIYSLENISYSLNSQRKVSTGIQASAIYKATSKISLTTTGVYRRIEEQSRSSDGFQNVITSNRSLTGNYRSLAFSVSYQLFRSTSLSCGVEKYARSASLFNRKFNGEDVNCSAVFSID